ncbi:2-methylcitrate dehydratase PrpD [Phyllobacterium sp. CL33Tsu]|uniref:MmgE/PrpD family protein n=1 Tax=Phyllobacterium sp. CL33Tsu TaxID=1798191 RepID=UPI0008E8E96C|nr:MmgE/PrpD family protein [Phyllobacterium sp. CL33Tsu]SFJ41361.1 2-methylcitrate dehydratase PrpD [Phyllobacterium sp. CL33Tsu]
MNQTVPPVLPVAARLASFAAECTPPAAVDAVSRRLLFDIVGLAVAARGTDYVAAALASAVDAGSCTAFGQERQLGLYDAALVNGTAAHGEDFDDTFEGGPIHAGAVVVSAVLAIAERRGLDGRAAMRGIAVGAELMCRMSLVAPQATHKAGFHPTAIFGAPAAAAAVGAALGLGPDVIGRALGISGSLASGIIEYLADGSSTKRLHAGAAAQAGVRAALLADAGFTGPISVFEGSHGLYRAFAPSKAPDFMPLLEGLGKQWIVETLAFKPYACGTMTQPFIDCAKKLAALGIGAEDIASIVCKVGEGTVHRLWEPLAEKQRPPNGYAGKFSTPYCMAVGFLDGEAGLGQFTDERVRNAAIRALAAKISYEINPADPYPSNFTGNLKAVLKDGTVHEFHQPYMRGGAREPLPDAEMESKFEANLRFGGLRERSIAALRASLEQIAAGGPIDLAGARA